MPCDTCQQSGGKLIMRGVKKNGEARWTHDHPACDQRKGLRSSGISTFPFVTSNISGEPVTVNSIQHLRRLENAHGVASAVYNQDGCTNR